MPASPQIPRTKAECRAAIKRWRAKAKLIRGLLADPGKGGEVLEQFTRTARSQAKVLEKLAAALEKEL